MSLTRMLAVLILGGVLGAGATMLGLGARPSEDLDLLRQVGAKLQGAGVEGEATRYYARYLELSRDIPPEKRASIALSLGELLMEAGRHEEALGWFYQVELLTPGGEQAKAAAPHIVACLERSGHSHAARSAMKSRTQVGESPQAAGDDDVIVASAGAISLRRSEVLTQLEAMPPAVRSTLQEPDGQKMLLEQLLGEKALYDKARTAGLGDNEDVRRRIEGMTRQVLVTALVEESARKEIRPSPQDIENFYQAHKAELGDKPLQEVQAQVQQAYLQVRLQELVSKMARDSLSGVRVDLFPERLDLPALPKLPPDTPAGGHP